MEFSRLILRICRLSLVANMKQIGVHGPDEELWQASKEFDNHALALTLLGNLLVRRKGGDVRKRDTIPTLFADPANGGHARRVMRAYEVLYEGKPELDVLRIMGLFDGPVDKGGHTPSPTASRRTLD